eukprot:TRINITY_DN59824_c0_g2_i1.p1 TRINITY_DN59824_c0_g2~~TRINITY_DN59824_c0_g2_i1.p1  ORF type:complete len:1329 (+),score=333.88 TRINITY_DN59824_c0_g2_i1:116-4102(+)
MKTSPHPLLATLNGNGNTTSFRQFDSTMTPSHAQISIAKNEQVVLNPNNATGRVFAMCFVASLLSEAIIIDWYNLNDALYWLTASLSALCIWTVFAFTFLPSMSGNPRNCVKISYLVLTCFTVFITLFVEAIQSAEGEGEFLDTNTLLSAQGRFLIFSFTGMILVGLKWRESMLFWGCCASSTFLASQTIWFLRADHTSIMDVGMFLKNSFMIILSLSAVLFAFEADFRAWAVHALEIAQHHQKEYSRIKKVMEQSAQRERLFMSFIFHEIRVPFNAIVGGIASMRITEGRSADDEELLEIMESQANVMHQILDDVLTIGKLEEKKLELSNKVFVLESLIKKCVFVTRGETEKKGISLTSHVSGKLPFKVLGDRNRLSQVIGNFLSNAIKFTHQGGHLSVVCSVGSSKPSNSDTVPIQIRVKDDGVGIAPDKVKSLFTPFFQVDAADLQDGKGTGLGLAICRHLIVDLFQGVVGCESIDGKGTVFFFEVLLSVVAKTKMTLNPKKKADRIFNLAQPRPSFRIGKGTTGHLFSKEDEESEEDPENESVVSNETYKSTGKRFGSKMANSDAPSILPTSIAEFSKVQSASDINARYSLTLDAEQAALRRKRRSVSINNDEIVRSATLNENTSVLNWKPRRLVYRKGQRIYGVCISSPFYDLRSKSPSPELKTAQPQPQTITISTANAMNHMPNSISAGLGSNSPVDSSSASRSGSGKSFTDSTLARGQLAESVHSAQRMLLPPPKDFIKPYQFTHSHVSVGSSVSRGSSDFASGKRRTRSSGLSLTNKLPNSRMFRQSALSFQPTTHGTTSLAAESSSSGSDDILSKSSSRNSQTHSLTSNVFGILGDHVEILYESLEPTSQFDNSIQQSFGINNVKTQPSQMTNSSDMNQTNKGSRSKNLIPLHTISDNASGFSEVSQMQLNQQTTPLSSKSVLSPIFSSFSRRRSLPNPTPQILKSIMDTNASGKAADGSALLLRANNKNMTNNSISLHPSGLSTQQSTNFVLQQGNGLRGKVQLPKIQSPKTPDSSSPGLPSSPTLSNTNNSRRSSFFDQLTKMRKHSEGDVCYLGSSLSRQSVNQSATCESSDGTVKTNAGEWAGHMLPTRPEPKEGASNFPVSPEFIPNSSRHHSHALPSVFSDDIHTDLASTIRYTPPSSPQRYPNKSNLRMSPLKKEERLTLNIRELEEERKNKRQQSKPKSKRILIVEDSKANRMIMARLIKQLGHEPFQAEDGQVCVDMHQDGEKFDLILMDFNMPNLGGIDATRILRAMGVEVKIIALTGNAVTEYQREFIDVGGDAVLLKPIKTKQFKQLLSSSSTFQLHKSSSTVIISD